MPRLGNGPSQHFVGTARSMRHYETAFYQHGVFNMDNYEKWEMEGSEDSYKKANSVWKKMLVEYEAPTLDEAIRDELIAFVNHRCEEIQKDRPRPEWKG